MLVQNIVVSFRDCFLSVYNSQFDFVAVNSFNESIFKFVLMVHRDFSSCDITCSIQKLVVSPVN